MAKARIGLQQARRLAQMKYDDRLDFIAEGLSINSQKREWVSLRIEIAHRP
jgi:hypothetical protein